jgi:hypothetical protein
MDKIKSFFDSIKQFMIDHSGPVLMLVLLAIGIAVFFIVYNALQKEK